jgi:REP element-mobilizing transposase RayT
LYAYMNGFLKNKNCHLYRINGMEDHLHNLTYIHPTIALATLVKDIKLASIDFRMSTTPFFSRKKKCK